MYVTKLVAAGSSTAFAWIVVHTEPSQKGMFKITEQTRRSWGSVHGYQHPRVMKEIPSLIISWAHMEQKKAWISRCQPTGLGAEEQSPLPAALTAISFPFLVSAVRCCVLSLLRAQWTSSLGIRQSGFSWPDFQEWRNFVFLPLVQLFSQVRRQWYHCVPLWAILTFLKVKQA